MKKLKNLLAKLFRRPKQDTPETTEIKAADGKILAKIEVEKEKEDENKTVW